MTAQARRPTAWLLWLLAFLAVELPAALRKTGGTLSEVSWLRWWPTKTRRVIPCAFLLVLTAHIFDGGQHWWGSALVIALAGAPVVLSIAWVELWERRSAVGLKDSVVKWFALKWLREKVKEGSLSKVLEALKGWKLVIGVVVVFGIGIYDQMANGHAGDLVGAVLTILGWMPAADWLTQIKDAVGPAIIIIGLAGKLITAYKQKKAGAGVSELLSTNGYVKAAVSDQGVRATLVSAGVPTAILKG